MTSPSRDPLTRRRAGWAGAASAGLAIGAAELAAGLFDSVPSAVASVGSFVVDWSPGWVKNFAIAVFGTADKGALAIGTAIIVLIIGLAVGRLALRHRWVNAAAFAGFGAVGIGAGLTQPLINPVATIVAIGGAAALGWFALDRMLEILDPRVPEAPTDSLPTDPGRRSFARLVAGTGVAAVAAGTAGRYLILRRSEAVREETALPNSVAAAPAPGPATSFSGVEGLTPVVVPNDDFYRIDTALVVPRPNPESWRLEITGMVERQVEYSLDELLAMELEQRYVTIACVSNEVGGNLVGNALWTGVPLTRLLDEAGVQEGATQIVPRSVDGWAAGFPTEAAFDGREPLVAVGMNGEPLPARHGFPARLIVPGLYGYVSATKWLEEIELTTWEGFDSYWVPKGWSKEGPIKTQSRIDRPDPQESVEGPDVVIAGVAWAPTLGVAAVEVRIDEGPWLSAELTTPLSDDAWVQWRLATSLAPGDHRVEVRATDGTGYTQTDVRSRPDPNGATGHHGVEFEVV